MGLRHGVHLLHPAIAMILCSTIALLVTGAGPAGVNDPFAVAAPLVVRDAVTERFPGFSIWSIKTTDAENRTLHEITVFDSRSTGLHGQRVNGATLHMRTTYAIVVSESGEVVSEEHHRIPKESVPRAALTAFSKWWGDRATGMGVLWGAYQESHQERVYVATIIINSLESHVLFLNQDGTIIRESQVEPDGAG